MQRTRRLGDDLGKAGWCHGRPLDRSEADAYWHKCVEPGSENMPQPMKDWARLCESATASDPTYPEAFRWPPLSRATFTQNARYDGPKVTDSMSEKDLDRLMAYAKDRISITITLPYTYAPFGGQASRMQAKCEFSDDAEGNVRSRHAS